MMTPVDTALAFIRETSFLMGSEDGRDDERPVHRVRVDAFQIGIHQVTNAEYDTFVQSTGYQQPPRRSDPRFSDPNQPIVAVSWFDAVNYCEWLSGVTHRRFRLPSEAEWECAARGGDEARLYPWGNTPPQSQPSYSTRWIDGPERVGRGTPNAYGLHDICENVHEWCADWYSPDYYASSSEHNPRGPEGGSRRVSRGGSWRHQIKIARCAARSSLPPNLHYEDYGFRVVCDPISPNRPL
jgi:formylglycine-generating enzyme required for sulfatase activity